jgi:hypothetical protein
MESNYRHPADADPSIQSTPVAGMGQSIHLQGEQKMKKTGLICGVIAAIALTGFSLFPTLDVPATAFKCTYETDCVITVSVTDTDPCVVSIDRPDIEMNGSYTWTGITHLIRWELDEPAVEAKFRFDKDKGVVLKSQDQKNQFSGQGPNGGKLQYHWRDKNSNTLKYEYDINIVQKGSAKTCKLDPKIFNN